MKIGDKAYRLKWDGLEWKILPGKVTHRRVVEEVRIDGGRWIGASGLFKSWAEAAAARKEKNK